MAITYDMPSSKTLNLTSHISAGEAYAKFKEGEKRETEIQVTDSVD